MTKKVFRNFGGLKSNVFLWERVKLWKFPRNKPIIFANKLLHAVKNNRRPEGGGHRSMSTPKYVLLRPHRLRTPDGGEAEIKLTRNDDNYSVCW